MFNNREYIPKLLTAATTQVFIGRGTLHSIIVGNTAATAIQLCDSASATTAGTMVILKASIAEGTYLIDAICANGLYVTNSASGSYTITYTKG